jgi:hypothetical protein
MTAQQNSSSQRWIGLIAVFKASVPKYWTGASAGNWSDANRWATTSGGSTYTTAPGAAERAVFDGGGLGSCTITSDVNVQGIQLGAAYTGTVTQGTGVKVTASAFTQAGGTFVGGNQTLTVSNSFVQTGGTFTGSSERTLIYGAIQPGRRAPLTAAVARW